MGHALGNNYGKSYSFLSKPVDLDLNFVVDSANGNGMGVRQVKGQGVKNVFMASSATFVGNTHTNTIIDGISGGTAALQVGMIIAGAGITAGTKITAISSGTAITVSPATTATAAAVTITYVAIGSPMENTVVGANSVGYALVELAYNYNRIYAGPVNIVSPTTGGTLAINAGALSVGKPYIIASVGHAASGTATIQPVADVAGSLASTWFKLFDAYGNTFIIWFSVSGVGSRPNLGPGAPFGTQGLHYVQQSIVANDTAATIGADLVVTIANLPSGVAGVNAFTASGTTTVTVVSTGTGLQLAGAPADGTAPTAFTFALTVFTTNVQDWMGVGLKPGVVPAVGAAFVATATGYSTGGGSTGLVIAPGESGITSVETIGNTNLSLAPVPTGPSANVGGWILVQFLNGTTPTAPVDGTVVAMTLYLEQSTQVGGNGE